MTANKTRDVFHNSEPLASLRLKNTWEGPLISVDLLKNNTYSHTLFIFLKWAFIWGGLYTKPLSVSILMGGYTGSYIWSFTGSYSSGFPGQH